MAAPNTSFIIKSDSAGRRVMQAIRSRFLTLNEPQTLYPRTYYDTFDWRLHAEGTTLFADRVESGWLLSWASFDHQIRYQLRTATMPAFAWDFPEGSFRDAISRPLEMRRLLPIVHVERRGHRLRVLDDNQKSVVHVDLEHAIAVSPNASRVGQRVQARLRLTPYRGYEAWRDDIARFLQSEFDLPIDDSGEAELALAAIGRTPGDYTSKLAIPLAPDMRTDEATKRILAALLNTILRNEDGARQDLDSEFLHDFRVAVRRTRTCLAQNKNVFPSDLIERVRSEFAWLGAITGPCRDLDVYLLNMADYRTSLPEKLQQDLEPLSQFLRRHQQIEQRRLADALSSERYGALIREWKQFLSEPLPSEPSLPNAQRPISETAVEQIRLCYDRVLARGAKIGADSPDAKLHRLRIDCKKLRYLLEFFRSLCAPGDLDGLVTVLKQLQDNLGVFNDLGVQQDSLTRFAREMSEEHAAAPQTLIAMGRLVERLRNRQKKERRRFAKRFATFATWETRRRVDRVLSSIGGGQR